MGNAMRVNKGDEIMLGELPQGGFAEMRVGREKRIWRCVEVGEITAPAPGNANLFGKFRGMVKNKNPATTLAGLDRTHQASRPCPDDHNIKILGFQTAATPRRKS
jgi:hypothetical protein